MADTDEGTAAPPEVLSIVLLVISALILVGGIVLYVLLP